MILPTVSFLREQMELTAGCSVTLGDVARLQEAPDALVLSLLGTKRMQPLQHRRGPAGIELSVLLSSYFRDYSAALASLDAALAWGEGNQVLNAPSGLLGPANAQLHISVTETAQIERLTLWRALAMAPLPSVVLGVRVIVER